MLGKNLAPMLWVSLERRRADIWACRDAPRSYEIILSEEPGETDSHGHRHSGVWPPLLPESFQIPPYAFQGHTPGLVKLFFKGYHLIAARSLAS
jgi:hypothetical protein